MIRSHSRWPMYAWWPASVLLATGLAHAQSHAPAAFTAPALEHRSLLDAYQGYQDQPVSSWREANDTVARMGGWRSYAKEAAQAEGPAAEPARPNAPTMPPDAQRGHGGHGPHHGHHGGRP